MINTKNLRMNKKEIAIIERENQRLCLANWFRNSKKKSYLIGFIKWLKISEKIALIRIIDLEIDVTSKLLCTSKPKTGDLLRCDIKQPDLNSTDILFCS